MMLPWVGEQVIISAILSVMGVATFHSTGDTVEVVHVEQVQEIF